MYYQKTFNKTRSEVTILYFFRIEGKIRARLRHHEDIMITIQTVHFLIMFIMIDSSFFIEIL
jgi:hypothetical protein